MGKHRACPWCGDDEMVMTEYPKDDVYVENIQWGSSVFVPTCTDCISGMIVSIDAKSMEEAWEIWDSSKEG